jgi:hypothetical protein
MKPPVHQKKAPVYQKIVAIVLPLIYMFHCEEPKCKKRFERGVYNEKSNGVPFGCNNDGDDCTCVYSGSGEFRWQADVEGCNRG